MAQSAPPRGYAHILTLKACQYELTHNKGLYSLNIKWPPHSHVPPKKINFSPKKETLLISFSIDKTNPEITLGQEGGLRLGGPMETLTMGMSCTALAPPAKDNSQYTLAQITLPWTQLSLCPLPHFIVTLH